MIEARLEAIETKISFQEDLVEELNKTIYEQDKKLQQLEAVCLALARQIQSVAESANDNKSVNERPPHY
jgi:SlyX protein